jgi:hypothetical protein
MRINLAYVRRLEDLILQLAEIENARAKGDLARHMPLLHKEAEAIRASRRARGTVKRGQTNKSNGCSHE